MGPLTQSSEQGHKTYPLVPALCAEPLDVARGRFRKFHTEPCRAASPTEEVQITKSHGHNKVQSRCQRETLRPAFFATLLQLLSWQVLIVLGYF